MDDITEHSRPMLRFGRVDSSGQTRMEGLRNFWNIQITIKASNQRGFETHNCYTAAPTRINQAHSIDDPASESKNTSKNTAKMQSKIVNIYEVNLN